MNNVSIKAFQIVSIIIVVLFVIMSLFDCVVVYREDTHHSQLAIGDPNYQGPAVTEIAHNNQPLRISIIGVIEIVLIIISCFKLSIVSAIIELILTVGTLCYGYIERLLVPIVGAGSPAYSVTFKVTMIGCLVGCLAMVNLIMTISLQGRKKKNP